MRQPCTLAPSMATVQILYLSRSALARSPGFIPFTPTLAIPVVSKGYGEKEGEQQKTSTLRHFLETVSAHTSALIEPIEPSVFHLNNEYWVSYFIGDKIYDKRFVFVPDSIGEANLTFIKEIGKEGVLHS